MKPLIKKCNRTVVLLFIFLCSFLISQGQSLQHSFYTMQIKREDWDKCVKDNFLNDFRHVKKLIFYFYTNSSTDGMDHWYIKSWAMADASWAIELPLKETSTSTKIVSPFFLSSLWFKRSELRNFIKVAVDNKWTHIILVPEKYGADADKKFKNHMYLKATIYNANGPVITENIGSAMAASTQVINPCPPCNK